MKRASVVVLLLVATYCPAFPLIFELEKPPFEDRVDNRVNGWELKALLIEEHRLRMEDEENVHALRERIQSLLTERCT